MFTSMISNIKQRRYTLYLDSALLKKISWQAKTHKNMAYHYITYQSNKISHKYDY